MTFPNFLGWLQGPGLNAAIGVLLSFLVEYSPQFCALGQKQKRLVTGGLCLALPLFASVVAILAGYQPSTWEASFWPALQAGAAAFGAATLAHTRKLAG